MCRYCRERRVYPSDVTDQEWAILELLIPAAKPGGRPQEIERREIVNGILYVLRSGCPWRMLPHNLPNWSPVYLYFREWKQAGIWAQVNAALRREVRLSLGREPEPSAAILESQSIKTSSVRGDARGYDGEKKVQGRKRHLLVDTLGLLLKGKVLAADISDREGAKVLLGLLAGKLPRLQLIWVDSGYDGKPLHQWVKEHLGVRLEVVKHRWSGMRGVWAPEGTVIDWDKILPKGFHVLKRRWVIERTNAWITHHRRLSRDFEGTHTSSESFISLAMSRMMVSRLARAAA
jgi:putative transposase